MKPAAPVSAAALRRLRRSYAGLMLLLGVPVVAAVVYVLFLQYELVYVGAQRQLAMSTDRRVTRLDGVLARMRDDLLRLRNQTRDPALARDVLVDLQSLQPAADGFTLDAMPVLLHDRAAQVLLAGAPWTDGDRRERAVMRAALFAEQARLLATQGGSFRRVWYVDADAGELWLYPWLNSNQLLAELGVASLSAAIEQLAARAQRPRTAVLSDEISWRVTSGADRRRLSLSIAGIGEGSNALVAAELPTAALTVAQVDAGIGRFWVLDGEGQVVLDHLTRDHPGGTLMQGAPPRFDAGQIDESAAAQLALPVGGALLAARNSGIAPWTGVYASDRVQVRAQVLRDMGPFIAVGAGLLALFLAVAALLWRHFGQPSLRLVDYLHRQAADPDATEPQVPVAWQPWLHLTRDTFVAWRAAAAREQRTEALKSSIVDHALAAVVTTDAGGRIVEFNPAAQQMFGRQRDQVIGSKVSDIIVPPRFRAAHEAGMKRLQRGEAPRMMGQRLEMAALRANGDEFPVEMVLWRTTVGTETFYTASLFDLTERIRANQEIERQRDVLRQSEKLTAMGSLLAGVAHELNNPLAIVMGRAALLESKVEGTELADEARRIREAADRCGRIVRTFLAMARNKPAARRPVQLNDLVRGAVDLLQYGLRSGGVELELKLAPDLPVITADADQLGQVVLNLLVNAQQALAQRDAPRRIHLQSGFDPECVWLRVADNGAGVSREHRARIFEAFFTTKAEGVGTGLGLAVSRSVAVEHGGELELEADSPSGTGASFRLWLPLHAAQIERRKTPRSAIEQDPAGARVLVVDDEPELADLMRETLENAGYEVAQAESGALALEMLATARFDAIVSDLRMADMDGAALWRAVGERHPDLARCFVFVTGDTLSSGAGEFLTQSGCALVEKPFAPGDLLSRVQTCLNRRTAVTDASG